jgi:secreted trypsin-like serine protease
LDNPEDDFESFKIVKYLPNPFYGVEAIFSSDFMLLLLDGNSSMPPLKTNRDEKVPQAGQNLTVVGLGADQDNFLDESFPTILQGATLNVVSNEECARTCETTTTGEVFTYDGSITNDSLCVWAPGKSYCFGDSGGPLIVQGRFPEEDVQSGIVSWYAKM